MADTKTKSWDKSKIFKKIHSANQNSAELRQAERAQSDYLFSPAHSQLACSTLRQLQAEELASTKMVSNERQERKQPDASEEDYRRDPMCVYENKNDLRGGKVFYDHTEKRAMIARMQLEMDEEGLLPGYTHDSRRGSEASSSAISDSLQMMSSTFDTDLLGAAGDAGSPSGGGGPFGRGSPMGGRALGGTHDPRSDAQRAAEAGVAALPQVKAFDPDASKLAQSENLGVIRKTLSIGKKEVPNSKRTLSIKRDKMDSKFRRERGAAPSSIPENEAVVATSPSRSQGGGLEPISEIRPGSGGGGGRAGSYGSWL